MWQIFCGFGLEFRLKSCSFIMFGMNFISITSVDVYFLGPTLHGWGWAHRSQHKRHGDIFVCFKRFFTPSQLVSERWFSLTEAWRSMQPPWRIQETSPVLLPTLQENPQEGWSLLWLRCLIWQTVRAEAGTRPLNPPPLTSWPPLRSRCQTMRPEEWTGGCRWWSWPETLPSLGGAVRPL